VEVRKKSMELRDLPGDTKAEQLQALFPDADKIVIYKKRFDTKVVW